MDRISQFLSAKAFAVIGASTNREKYGNKVLRCYMQHLKKVFPVNPRADTIEGITCFKDIGALPKEVTSLSIITPPRITESVVEEAYLHGIKNIWMQPGAENDQAINYCLEHKINIIAHGPCILVSLGYSEQWLP